MESLGAPPAIERAPELLQIGRSIELFTHRGENEQYQRVEQYSQDPRDLGTLPLDDYKRKMAGVFKGLLPILRPRGHCVVNVPDMWWENRHPPGRSSPCDRDETSDIIGPTVHWQLEPDCFAFTAVLVPWLASPLLPGCLQGLLASGLNGETVGSALGVGR